MHSLLNTLIVVALWLTPAATHKPLEMTLDRHVTPAPGDVIVRVRVEPHADNRFVLVVVNGPMYVSSLRPLHGEESPATQPPTPFRGLSEGHYTILAVLYRRDTEIARVSSPLIVGGIDGTP